MGLFGVSEILHFEVPQFGRTLRVESGLGFRVQGLQSRVAYKPEA